MRLTGPLIVALAFIAGCPTPYMSRISSEKKTLAKQLPVELEAPNPYTGKPRVAKIRVYADEGYRSKHQRWQNQFGEELDYANQYLQPLLGLQLEAEYKVWDRAGDTPLRVTLDELAKLDPGDDVAWVIGLTSSLESFSDITDDLGMSYVLGTHIVLRGYSDVKEREQFEKALPDMSAADREEVHDARRRHKQTVLLVHELGHTLGAIHETDESWIMYPKYSTKQATVSDRNRELMMLAIPDHILPKKSRDVAATAAKLAESIDTNDWGGWVPQDKSDEVDQLHHIIDAGKAEQTASDVPSPIVAQYDHARDLAGHQQWDDALAELEPIIAAYPANATLRMLRCDVYLHKSGPKDKAAQDACDRAVDLAQGDPRPHVLIASAFLAANDIAGARAQLEQAEAKIPNLPKPAQGWTEMAQLYQSMGALTWAENAAAKSGDPDSPVLAWAKQTRARYGVPASGKGAPKPEDEADAVAAVRQILDAVYASKFADATKAAKTAGKRFPHLPGLDAATCDLELRQEQLGSAKKKCAAAIAAYPDASWAQYLMGIIIMRGTSASDTKDGIAHLKLAIAADPDLAQAWRALDKAYYRAKDADAAKQLETDYETRFGQPLGN